MGRISETFERLRSKNKAAFIAYIMAGDPDRTTSQAIFDGLPAAGVDIIELGLPFTDPVADGEAVQMAGLRALKSGQTVRATLDMVADFRARDTTTPVLLMGYFNPLFSYGVERFVADAATAGVDGLIIVDVPPEEDDDLCRPARAAGIDFIRLVPPTTDGVRLARVARDSGGFIYYVSVTGTTGAAAAVPEEVAPRIEEIRKVTGLPVVVGFGIRTAAAAAKMAAVADGVAVGSAIVSKIAENGPVEQALEYIGELSAGAHSARA
ncbi:MAG: tryptophan synthase subunit alpha [Rhizobiaceae bacterium]|nr:tryptophan synthase subunit alpha [Rhizobiaceae bacterium]